MQTLGKNESVSTSLRIPLHNVLRIIKKYVSKKSHIFHAPEKPANQEANFNVISNVMTFLTLHVKV